MSYTAPQYVDTKEQAVLALASTIKGEAVTGGDGSVNRALDILADVLAKQDVQVPQTNAGAILALADYVSGGGGGSSDFTTAEVTIVNSTAASFEGTMPMAFDGEVSGAASEFYVDVNETIVLTAILYKGHSAAIIHPEGTVAIEGSATDLGDGFIDVTGDCTITVS